MARKSKGRILVCGEKNRIVYHRFARILSKEFIVKEFYVIPDSNKPKPLLKRWLFVSKEWKKILRDFKPDKVLTCGGSLISLWIIIFLIRLHRLKIEIIQFRYDIEYFRKFPKGFKVKFAHFIARILEKYSLLTADKIITKGSETELKFLPFYEKIKNKPHYLTRDFLDKNLIQKCNPKIKLSRKDGRMHTVYGGGWHYEDANTSDSFFRLYEPLLKNKCHVHVYNEADNKNKEKFRAFEKKYPYFHYEGYINRKKLIKEYPKYDFGLNFFGFLNENKNNDVFVKTAFSNKNFDYIITKLPILTNIEAKAKSDFVVDNKIGFSFKLKDYNKASIYKRISDKKRYSGFIKNIEKFINKNLSNERFLKFIEG